MNHPSENLQSELSEENLSFLEMHDLSSPVALTGMKRARADLSDISISPIKPLKKLCITHNWNEKFIGTDAAGYAIQNPNFVPKYLCERLPIPMPILNRIYNKHLTVYDREVIEGDMELCKQKTGANPLYRIKHIWPATSNSWFVGLETFSYADWPNPNSP